MTIKPNALSFRQLFVLIIVALALSACTTTSKTYRTSGHTSGALVSGPISIELDPYWPSTISIQQAVVRSPLASKETTFEASASQKQQAQQNSSRLKEIVRVGTQTELPARFEKIGFRTSNLSGKVRKLKLRITGIQMRCSAHGHCSTVAHVRIELDTPENADASWYYIGEFGQPPLGGEITADQFNSFVDSLIASMEKDGLLPARKI